MEKEEFKHALKSVSINMLIFQVSTSIHMLLKVRRTAFLGVIANWLDLHDKLKHHIPRLRYTKVLWKLPLVGWIKCNMDGACRGNTRRPSYAFVLRTELVIYSMLRRMRFKMPPIILLKLRQFWKL